MLSDFYRRDTDIDFFLTYVRAKTDDTLSKLMSTFNFTLEEKQKTDLLINESEESLSRDGKKVSKQFLKYGEKLMEKLTSGKKEKEFKYGKELEKLMMKVKRVAAKSLAREHKKMLSTQNSDRLHAPDLTTYDGPLRQA